MKQRTLLFVIVIVGAMGWTTATVISQEQRGEEGQPEPKAMMEAYKFGASLLRNSNFLNVAALWRISKELPILVNTVIQKDVAEIDRQQENAISSSEDQLGKELELAKKSYEAAKNEIEAFRQTADFSSITSQEASEKVLILTALVTELEVEMLGRKTQWETLQNVTPEKMPITADLHALLARDPSILRLEQDLVSAEQNLNLAIQRFGPNHRATKNTRFDRDSAASQVEQERAVKILDFQKQQLDYSQRNFLEAQEQLLVLREKLIDAKAEQSDKDVKKARYESLLDERDQARFRYESLLQNKNDVSMVLKPLVGHWAMVVRGRDDPDEPWKESKGTTERKWVLDGRFLIEESKIEMIERVPLQRLGISGYDKVKKKYVYVCASNFGTDFIILEGTCDASGKVITFHGEIGDPMSGQTKAYKSVLRIINNNEHVLEVYDTTPGGKEFKSAEVTYTRK